jgi:hypothetical protein
LEFRVYDYRGQEFKEQGVGRRVKGLGSYRVWGLGFWV